MPDEVLVTTPIIRVMYAEALAGPWTEAKGVRWLSDEVGVGRNWGSMSAEYYAGIIARAATTGAVGLPIVTTPMPDEDFELHGRYVRVEESTDGGATWSANWYGIGAPIDVTPSLGDRNAGRATIRCVGIGSLTENITCNRTLVQGAGSTFSFVNQAGVFNANPNRGAAGPVAGVYLYDGDTASGDRWTAGDIIQHLLYVCPDSNTWEFDDPLGITAYDPGIVDLTDKSLAQALDALIPATMGMTYTIAYNTVSGNIKVRVYSCVGEAITVGATTVPAAETLVNLDVKHSRLVSNFTYSIDDSTTSDVIEVLGARPWVTMTLDILGEGVSGTAGLIAAWDPAVESTWEAFYKSSSVRTVWRTFKLNPNWNGNVAGSTVSGLRTPTGELFDNSYGDGGADGTRVFTSGEFPGTTSVVELTEDTPCSESFGILRQGWRQKATVFVDYTGTNSWQEVNWDVQVSMHPLRVTINDTTPSGTPAFGCELRGIVKNGGSVRVTLGLREPDRLRVAWVRPADQRKSDIARRTSIVLTDAEQWVRLDGTMIRADSAGAPVTATYSVIDEALPRLRNTLALARAWYEFPWVRVTWDHRGTNPGYALGDYLVDAVVAGRKGEPTEDTTIELGCTLTRIRRTLVRDSLGLYVTRSYETDSFWPRPG